MKKTAGRKRKSTALAVRSSRRRLATRRRPRRRTVTVGSRQLTAQNAFTFRSKKVSARRWRQMLWRDSAMKTHYRSIQTFAPGVGLSTPANTFELNFLRTSAMVPLPGLEFWKTLGGMQDPSFGIGVDWAQPSGAGVPEPITIIVRGGVMCLRVANPSTTDTINIRAQLIFTKSQTRDAANAVASNTLIAYEAAIGTGPRPLSWSIQAAPDYSQYYHPPIMDKSIDLKPGDDINFFHRMKVFKLDCEQFKRGASWFPIWVVYASQSVDTTAGAQAVTIHTGHNMSFSVMETNDV